MNCHTPLLVATLVMILGVMAGASTPTAQFFPLGQLTESANISYAFDVSADGAVVVGGGLVDATGGVWAGFRWTESTGMVPLASEPPLTFVDSARAVSADGTVIVAGGQRWTVDGLTSLDGMTGLGVSSDGTVIVGFVNGPSGTEAAYWTEASGLTVVGALGTSPIDAWFSDATYDAAVATGQSMIDLPDVEALRWTQQTGLVGLGDVPGGLHYALGWGVSEDGSIIVGETIGDVGSFEAFRWTSTGGLELLDPAAAGVFGSSALDVTADGRVVAGYSGHVGGGAIRDASHCVRSIQAMLENDYGLDLPGWTLGTAYAISDDKKTVVGSRLNPEGKTGAWAARFPTGE